MPNKLLLILLGYALLFAAALVVSLSCIPSMPAIAPPAAVTNAPPALPHLPFLSRKPAAAAAGTPAPVPTRDERLEFWQETLRCAGVWGLWLMIALCIGGVLIGHPRVVWAGVIGGGGVFVAAVVLGEVIAGIQWILLAAVLAAGVWLYFRVQMYGWAGAWHQHPTPEPAAIAPPTATPRAVINRGSRL